MSYKINQPSKHKFSTFVSYRKNKLIIRFPSNIAIAVVLSMTILFVALDIFFGVNLPLSLPVSIIDELFIMPKALNSSQLNCTNAQGQISCSLSGNYLFGREEKVINDKRGRLLKVNPKSIDILSRADRLITRNDLLVLITEREEIYLYTSPNLIDEQITKLREFPSTRSQLNLYINTNKSHLFNVWCIRGYSSYNILLCITLYLMILLLVMYILSRKTYIFDKDRGKLIALAFFGKKHLFEIQLDRIKEIRLYKIIYEPEDEHSEDYQQEEFYKISIFDVDDKSYFIPILFIGSESRESEARKIAGDICIFLNLGTYMTIEVKRNFFEFLPRLWE